MAHRTRIGIPFNYDESWIGGTYYIKNLVSSFNVLPPSTQPDVWVLTHTRESFDFILDASRYKRLRWLLPSRLAGFDQGRSRRNRLLSFLSLGRYEERVDFDVIFPYPIDEKYQQTVCWIPDFQDKRLPQYFSADELERREQQHRSYIDNFKHIVFSSEAVRSDFRIFYPAAAIQTHVVHFATFNQAYPLQEIANVTRRYRLPERYFYCANQFWIHKNHETVIRAVEILKAKGVEAFVAFSGKEHDHRAPDYVSNLKAYVSSRGLEKNVTFLGFLPRADQMTLLKNAIAIIQPSLFEGWSTVVEDAKSESQYVLASDISTHREQISENVEFFDSQDPYALAGLLEQYATVNPPKQRIDYSVAQRQFADAFMEVVRTVGKTDGSLSGAK